MGRSVVDLSEGGPEALAEFDAAQNQGRAEEDDEDDEEEAGLQQQLMALHLDEGVPPTRYRGLRRGAPWRGAPRLGPPTL